MALAILRFQDSDGSTNRFQVDLGTNRFYRYAIGSSEKQQNGLKLLENPIYTSPIIGPLPESSLGRTILEVPNNQFDRQHRLIQITSFRTPDQIGPACSDVVQVMSISSGSSPVNALSFENALSSETAMNRSPIETVPFQYREVRPVSEAMSLGGILNAVKNVAGSVVGAVAGAAPALIAGAAPTAGSSGIASIVGSVLPQLTGVIGGVLPQLIAGAGTPATGATPAGTTDPAVPGQPADSTQLVNLLAALLQQIGSTPPATASVQPGVASIPVAAPPIAAPVAGAVLPQTGGAVATLPSPPPPPPPARPQPVTNRAPGATPQRHPPLARARSFDSDQEYRGAYAFSASAAYSESMFLPAIGGILAAIAPKLLSLAPSLLQMFGPQLMQTFTSLLNPQAAMSGQMSTMLGIESEDAEDEAVLIALSLALAAAPTPDLVYRRIGAVTLAFTQVSPVMLHGRSRFLYRQDQEIAFPLKIETPKSIKRARLQLLVKHPKTLEVLIEQNYRLEGVTSGTVDVVPKLSKAQLQTLAANQEYLVCLTLVWRGRSRQTGDTPRIGTSTMQLITLVGEYLFDRVEGTGNKIPLNDVDRFRPYWHKVWEGKFSEKFRRIDFDCKYYYTLETHRTENARMETVTQVKEDIVGRSGRMKSGLILSPFSLNELLPQISSHPRLSEAELSALLTSEFKQQFNHLARTQVKFKGRRSDAVALWIYPEFKLQQVMLKQVEQTNANGHVLTLKEHPIYFPMPAIAHFIGVSTQV